MGWVVAGFLMAAITAVITWLGLRAQRSKPERRWPIIVVGLAAGLVAGLAIIQAIWMGNRYPRRIRLIDGLTVLVASSLMFVVAYTVYGPPFGVGTPIESGTIARPEHGYSITLPDDWRVEDISDVEELFGEVVEPGLEPELMAVDGEGSTHLLVATIDAGEEISAGIVAFGTLSELKSDPLIEDVAWHELEICGQPASRIDATLMGMDGDVYDGPVQLSLYLVSADQRHYQALYFYSQSAPRDRWQGVAQTLEYGSERDSARWVDDPLDRNRPTEAPLATEP
jgi:hypothetical protein